MKVLLLGDVESSRQIDEKLRIMSIYSSEVQPEPFPRSIEAIRAQARYRGSQAHMTHAEAFQQVRTLWPDNPEQTP